MNPSPIQNPFDFQDRVVVVTGSAKGIGSGIALRFAQAGACVAVHYRTSLDCAKETASGIRRLGRPAAIFHADVGDAGQVEGLLRRVIAEFGHVDIWVNNAGVYPSTPLLQMSADEWDQVIDGNLRSVFLCTQAAARQMVAQGSGGVILNIASIESQMTAPGHSHYNAAKAGVVMHTRIAARELGKYAIRVNCISPGLVWRPGIEQDEPDFVTRWEKTTPLGCLGRPEDIAEACLFLASDAARWITGVNLPVDGGALTR
jgi:NAD(P)-dependent dehydrogenase (short-subunit alcohol dehydrogenase family)